MKTTKMLTILVLALGLMVGLFGSTEAAPMGTAWTYQGRLMDANSAADGLVDKVYNLWNRTPLTVGRAYTASWGKESVPPKPNRASY